MKLHKDQIADEKAKLWNKMHWDEMSKAQDCINKISESLKVFETSFDDNFFYSDKDTMSSQWDKLNAMLHEFIDEVNLAKNIESYYK